MNRPENIVRPRADLLRLGPPPGSRIALVGGCGGVGRPVVEACVELDLNVAVLDLPASIERHTPPPGVRALGLDATDPAAVGEGFAALDAAWGGLDALIFLVGFTITPPTRLEDVRPEQWDEVLAGNLRSAWLVARAALPLLRRGEDPCIVNVSSTLGVNVLPGFGPYAAAKAGLIALTKGLAVECAPQVRANTIAPSAMHTAFMGGGTGRGGDEGGHDWFTGGNYTQAIPLGRLAVPDDVVAPILFLASPGARFITGQTLLVNGGRLMP
jgi:3-oxoacyl-[acyl-carrier protein] reductase